jgi:hypothetical protein
VRWEYAFVEGGTTQLPAFSAALNEWGSLGWEICGWASADRPVGPSAYVAVLKRPVPTTPPPGDSSPGWHADPFGRAAHRYWDGVRWTERVADGDEHRVDFPLGSAAPPVAGER